MSFTQLLSYKPISSIAHFCLTFCLMAGEVMTRVSWRCNNYSQVTDINHETAADHTAFKPTAVVDAKIDFLYFLTLYPPIVPLRETKSVKSFQLISLQNPWLPLLPFPFPPIFYLSSFFRPAFRKFSIYLIHLVSFYVGFCLSEISSHLYPWAFSVASRPKVQKRSEINENDVRTMKGLPANKQQQTQTGGRNANRTEELVNDETGRGCLQCEKKAETVWPQRTRS